LPKEGFAVITLTDEACKRAKSHYRMKSKKGLISKNISFSRFVTELLERALENDSQISQIEPLFRKLGTLNDSIVVTDRSNQIAEVKIIFRKKGAELFCVLDKRADCAHVGFAYSTPELYQFIHLKRKSQDLAKRKRHPIRLSALSVI